MKLVPQLLSIITLVCLSFLFFFACSSGPSGNGWVDLGLKGKRIDFVAVSLTNDKVIYAGGYSEIFRSDDGGQNWQKTNFSGGPNLIISPVNPNCVYTAGNRIFKTTDGGQTIMDITPSDLGNNGIFKDLGIAPSKPEILYASYMTISSRSILKTVDGGKSWTNISKGIDMVGEGVLTGVLFLAVDPSNPNVVFVGNINGIYKTIDGGNNWLLTESGFKMSNLPLRLAIDRAILC